MLRIPCPYCGDRNEDEFSYGGEADIVRPEDSWTLSDDEWADYLFMRENPKGPHAERWCHSHGCGRWFDVVRDTATHEILGVYKIGERQPEKQR